ncbi:hypothetical protein ACI1US_01008 [Leucobacter sp. BZR 635]
MTDLGKLEELAKAATPGPWEQYTTLQADSHVTAGGGLLTGTLVCGPTYHKGNAEFIAAANPAAMLALIADHRAARARIAKVEALHQRGTPGIGTDWCVSCETKWPCQTVRALTEGENE